MPAQWPGNTVSKMARAKTGGGFESDIPPIAFDEPDLTLPAGNIVSDDFASGDLSTTGPANDFDWTTMRFTSLVTMDPATDDPTVIYTSGGSSVYNVLTGDPRNWKALHGNNCMRFSFNLGTDTNVFAEQRWGLLSRFEKTIWLRFALRVPTNYFHENVPDIYGEPTAPTANNKLFFLWTDSYSNTTSGGGVSVGMEFGPTGDGGSYFYIKNSGPTDIGLNKSDIQPYTPFISYPEDLGRWMYVAVKLVTESATGASDGSCEVWRKWSGQSAWTNTHALFNQPYQEPTNGSAPGWSGGYFMGADNSGYREDTEFLIDNVNLSTVSLL